MDAHEVSENEGPETKSSGVASEVTLITPIKPGRVPGEIRTYRKRLNDILDALKRRADAGLPTPIDVLSTSTIHFARWVVLNEDTDRPVLLFTSNYDGDMRFYFRSFVLEIGPEIDRIWNNCVGYPQGDGFDAIWKYVKAHQVETRAFYGAYPALTVRHIRRLERLRGEFDRFLAVLQAQRRNGRIGDPLIESALDKLIATAYRVDQTPVVQAPDIAPKKPKSLKENLADIQGNIVRGGKWREAGYAFLQIVDPDAFRAALGRIVADRSLPLAADAYVSPKGKVTPPEFGVNIGFTADGLARIGVPRRLLDELPIAFRQGMAARARELGDDGESAPKNWQWDYCSDRVDALFAVYAGGNKSAAEVWQTLLQVAGQEKLDAAEISPLPGARLVNWQVGARLPAEPGKPAREHFGFRDGVSQPWLDDGGPFPRGGGALDDKGEWRPLAAGEFFLGHADEDGADMLALFEELAPADRDALVGLCQNGTFMVFRKLRQDVRKFSRYTEEIGNRFDIDPDEVAERMVGRRRDGTPLVKSRRAGELNDFTYADDPAGLACPHGAHIRRANPRDSLKLTVVNRHRIIRRGITYEDDAENKGLLFVAFNARLETQFEFLQREWLNKSDFIKAFNIERDPIAAGVGPYDKGTFTLPLEGKPPEVAQGLSRFVTLRGGGYFFVPGLAGLTRLAEGGFDAGERDRRPLAPGAEDPDHFDPVAYAGMIDVQPLLKERRIETRRIREVDAADKSVERDVHYVACFDHVKAALLNEHAFTVKHYRDTIVDLEAKNRNMLLGMTMRDEQKLRRLGIFAKLVETGAFAAAGKLARSVSEQVLSQAQAAGHLEVVRGLAYAIPLARIARLFGIPGPTSVPPKLKAAILGQTDPNRVSQFDWDARFDEWLLDQGYRDPPAISAFVMAGWVRIAAIDILLNVYRAQEAHELAKGVVKELQDHLGAVFRAEQARQDNGERPGENLVGAIVAQVRGIKDPAIAAETLEQATLLLLEMVIGGVDTTAKAITLIVDTLLSDDDAMAAAVAAVDLANDQATAVAGAERLTAVIREILRLRPVAPITVRTCEQAARLPAQGGRKIQPGDLLFLLNYAAMRDPAAYDNAHKPEDLQRFDADRPPPETTLDFGLRPDDANGGVPRCIGRQIVFDEVGAVLRVLLGGYTLRRAPGEAGRLKETFRLPDSLTVRLRPR